MKKLVLGIVIVVTVVGIIGGTIWGKNYYETRYAGTDYYARVPADFDVTPEPLSDLSGEEQSMGKEYNLTAYNEKGEAKEVSFEVIGEDSAKYPQPGAFLLVNASKQIVLKHSVIEETSVPETALEKIKGNQ